jgi:hypothetical protein
MPDGPIYLNTLETHGLQLSSLLAELEENFPQVNPNPSESVSQIMYRSGQRSVVEWIQQRLNEDNG